MTLVKSLLNAAAEGNASITFVRAGGTEDVFPYRDLYSGAMVILGSLQENGLGPGDELIIQVEDDKLFVSIFWACILGKILPVPLSVGIKQGQRKKVVEVWKCLSRPFLICGVQQKEWIVSAAREEELSGQEDLDARVILLSSLSASTHPAQIQETKGSDIAYIQFSSGSTGLPKGVCLTHDNLTSNISDIIESLRITGRDTLLSWMPMTHDMGMIGFHLTGIVRNIDSISLPTAVFIRRPLLWMAKASEHRASVLYSPNFGFQYFLSSFSEKTGYGWDLSHIRIIVNGAEPVSKPVCDRFTLALNAYGLKKNSIVAAYGLAEASVEVAVMPVGDELKCHYLHREYLNIGKEAKVVEEGDRAAVGFVDVGRGVSNCSLRICDDQDIELGEGHVGHIQIRGSNVTRGYYNNPAATRELFTAGGWLRTGDIGLLMDERLVVTGRSKNIIIINGQNIYPQDIEWLLIKEGVSETGKIAVCGIGVEDREEVAVFLLHKGEVGTFVPVADKVKDILFRSLDLTVSDVIPVRSMPKTTSGKIQYFLLKEQYLRGDLTGVYRGKKDMGVADAVKTVLGQPELHGGSDLYGAGMTSLAAMQLAGRIYRSTGVLIGIGDIFACNSIDALDEYIHSATRCRMPVALPPGDNAPTFQPSLAQERIWWECELKEKSAAYNIPVVFTLSGNFMDGFFETAVRKLIYKYDILRTSFEMSDGQLVQKVHPYDPATVVLRRVDLRNTAVQGNTAWRLVEEEVNEVFDLRCPSQIRTLMIRLNEDSYTVALVFHHILCDGWSIGILLNELSGYYNRLKQGGTMAFPADQTVSFQKYVDWQKKYLGSEMQAKDRAYWLNELKEIPFPVCIPAKKQLTPKNEEITLGNYRYSFDRLEYELLKEHAEQFRVTRFCIIMTFLNILLYRHTNKKDIVMGFDVTGRFSEEMEEVVGYVLNTLFLRTPITGETLFPDLVAKVKEKLFAAFDHQLYPFEKIIEDLAPGRNGNTEPLFQVLVLYQDFHRQRFDITLDDCSGIRRNVAVREGFVDVTFEFEEKEDGLDLTVYYNSSRYEGSYIGALTGHLGMLIKSLRGNAEAKIGHLPMLMAEENAVLSEFSGPGDDTDEVFHPVHMAFESQVANVPDAIAVCAGDRCFTYRQLNDRANAISRTLKSKNAVPGNNIGFVVGRNEKILFAILSILKTGAAYVAMDPDLPVARYTQIAEDSGMQFLLTDSENAGRLKTGYPQELLINIDEVEDAGAPENSVYRGPAGSPAIISADSPAYIIYTSGTTGHPKGIVVRHGTLAGYVARFTRYYDLTHNDTCIQLSSVAFDTLVEEIFPALGVGAKVVISPDGGRNMATLKTLISTKKITLLSSTPMLLNEINEQFDDSFASLRLVISGGDILFPSNVDTIFKHVAVYNTYGPSEATVCVTYNKVDELSRSFLLGRPIAGRRIYIVDENMQLLPANCPGEICIEGGLADGYLNLPELSNDKFIANPFSGKGKLYRTGDMGRWTSTGELEFAGRLDRQVKINGYRIEPEEIERAIYRHGSVRSAVIFTDENSHHLIAVLVAEKELAERELRVFLAGLLPFYMIPRRIEFVDEMPLTITGKVDRTLLKKNIGQKGLAAETVRPRTYIEEVLVDVWREILHVEIAGITGNFFEMGGDSIKAHLAKMAILQRLGREIKLSDMFIYPTIADLGNFIQMMEEKEFDYIEVA